MAALAAEEADCPAHAEPNDSYGTVCPQGCVDGKLPRYPMLRVWLGHQHCVEKGFCTYGLSRDKPMHDCHGLGYTVSSRLEDWLLASGSEVTLESVVNELYGRAR